MTPQADDDEPTRPEEDAAQRSPDDSLAALVDGVPRTAEGTQVNGHRQTHDGYPPDLSREGGFREGGLGEGGLGEGGLGEGRSSPADPADPPGKRLTRPRDPSGRPTRMSRMNGPVPTPCSPASRYSASASRPRSQATA